MFKIDLLSKKSIYEQITDGIKGMILSGEYKPGDKIVSVRELSTQLTINPNTIQKAFKALESQGYICTVSGKGSFVSEQKNSVSKETVSEMLTQFDSLCKEMAFAGVKEEELVQRLHANIQGEGEK